MGVFFIQFSLAVYRKYSHQHAEVIRALNWMKRHAAIHGGSQNLVATSCESSGLRTDATHFTSIRAFKSGRVAFVAVDNDILTHRAELALPEI